MNIVIAGAGEVGGHAATVLSGEGHGVTVIDLNVERLQQLSDRCDLSALTGHCAHFDVLFEAGVDKCDLMIAATKIDEINLLSASMAKAAGAKRTVVRVHHTANFSLRGTKYAANLGIDEFLCPEYLASVDIARSLRNPGSLALEEFAKGRLVIQRIAVEEGAAAVGQRLRDLRLPGRNRLATVEHGDKQELAHSETIIHAGDYVTLVGEPESFEAARKYFSKSKDRRIHVAVMGETSAAVWLCRALRNRVFAVRLFVTNHGRALELSEKLSHVTVLEADPTDSLTVTDEHMERFDVFVAATDDDEQSILACAQAKSLGVPKAIAVLQRAKYQHLLHHLGIDESFSPRSVAVSAILTLIDTRPVRPIASFAEGTAEVYEVRASHRAKTLGKPLRELKLPTRSMIAAIRRGDSIVLPGADDQISLEDTVLVIGPPDIDNDLKKLFALK